MVRPLMLMCSDSGSVPAGGTGAHVTREPEVLAFQTLPTLLSLTPTQPSGEEPAGLAVAPSRAARFSN